MDKYEALAETYRLRDRADELIRVEGDYDQALSLLTQAREICTQHLEYWNPEVALVYNSLANAYMFKGDFPMAEDCCFRALTIRESSVALSLNNLGALYDFRDDFEKAREMHKLALEIRKRVFGQDSGVTAESYMNLARLSNNAGRFHESERLYRQALVIHEKVAEKVAVEEPNYNSQFQCRLADALNGLGSALQFQGYRLEALRLHQRALSIQEKYLDPQHPAIAVSLTNIGWIFESISDDVKANDHYLRAAAIQEKRLGQGHFVFAQTLSSAADLYRTRFHWRGAQEDYQNAKSLYLRALAGLEEVLGTDDTRVANVVGELAFLYLINCEYDQAEPLYLRALDIQQRKTGISPDRIADTLNGLGETFRRQKNYIRAREYHERALAIREEFFGGRHYTMAITLNNLSLLASDEGDYENAISLLERSGDIFEQSVSRNLLIGSERQKTDFLDSLTHGYANALALHIQSAPDSERALRLAFTNLLRRKGRVLDAMTDTVAQLRLRATKEDRRLFDEIFFRRSQMAELRLQSRADEDVEAHRGRLKELEDRFEQLEAEISMRSAEFRQETLPITLEGVQDALPANSVLIEFALYQPVDSNTEAMAPLHYVAYALPSQGRPQWTDLGEIDRIERAIERFREALRNPSRSDVKAPARELDQMIMEPVRRFWEKVEHVLVSPDGALNLIPFGALIDEEGRYLVERYLFTYLASGRDLQRFKVGCESNTESVVVADPNFDTQTGDEVAVNEINGVFQTWGLTGYERGRDLTVNSPQFETQQGVDLKDGWFRPLHGTSREAEAIAAILPQSVLLTKQNAAKNVLRRISRPYILHIATHGFFLSETNDQIRNLRSPLLRSGLALAGANRHHLGDYQGLLFAIEAAGLDLWGTKLVVLSACDTGVGDVKYGEGVYGLRRALSLAGSESQVLSLWKVADEETCDLMTAFYRYVCQGHKRGEALRHSQLQMLSDTKLQHPYFWASFILSGKWDELYGQLRQSA